MHSAATYPISDTKGHKLHLAGQPTQTIQFPGMVALYERFWSEVPKTEFDPHELTDSSTTGDQR